MFGHTQIVWISLAVETLLFVSVFVILFVYKFACLLKIFGGYNVQINIGVVIKPFWRLNTNYLYLRLYTRSRLSIGCGRQSRFAFIHEADIRYTHVDDYIKSADTTAKGRRCFSKELATLSLRQRDGIWSRISIVMLAVWPLFRRIFHHQLIIKQGGQLLSTYIIRQKWRTTG